jgi:iron complex outermembrane receptor protein
VYELYYATSPYLSNPALNSEKIRNAEFIWEQGLGTHLWFSTSAFYSSIQDLITQESVGDNFIFRNLKNVRSSGLEVEVKGQLSPGLEGRASYSFQQTKDTSSGQFLSNSPRNLVTLNLSQPLWGKRMFVSLDAQYRSRIQNLAGGSISPFAVVNATLLARNLGKRVDLSASIYNLLDKQYFDPPSTENLQQAIQQDGRSFRVKMTWRWGGR